MLISFYIKCFSVSEYARAKAVSGGNEWRGEKQFANSAKIPRRAVDRGLPGYIRFVVDFVSRGC